MCAMPSGKLLCQWWPYSGLSWQSSNTSSTRVLSHHIVADVIADLLQRRRWSLIGRIHRWSPHPVMWHWHAEQQLTHLRPTTYTFSGDVTATSSTQPGGLAMWSVMTAVSCPSDNHVLLTQQLTHVELRMESTLILWKYQSLSEVPLFLLLLHCALSICDF